MLLFCLQPMPISLQHVGRGVLVQLAQQPGHTYFAGVSSPSAENELQERTSPKRQGGVPTFSTCAGSYWCSSPASRVTYSQASSSSLKRNFISAMSRSSWNAHLQ